MSKYKTLLAILGAFAVYSIPFSVSLYRSDVSEIEKKIDKINIEISNTHNPVKIDSLYNVKKDLNKEYWKEVWNSVKLKGIF